MPCRPGFHVTFTSAGRAVECSLGLQRQSSATIPLGERQQDEINCRRESPVSRMALSLELLALSGSSGCRAFFRSLDPLFRGLGSVWVSWAALLYVPHLVQSPSTHLPTYGTLVTLLRPTFILLIISPQTLLILSPPPCLLPATPDLDYCPLTKSAAMVSYGLLTFQITSYILVKTIFSGINLLCLLGNSLLH